MRARGVTRWESDGSYVQRVCIEMIESFDRLLCVYKGLCTKIRSTVQVSQEYLTSKFKNPSIFEIRAVPVRDPWVIKSNFNTVFDF